MRLRPFAALLILSILVPAAAHAEITDADKATARELTIQGGDLLKARDFAGAADRFSRAEKLFVAAGSPVPPTIRVGLARAYTALGKLVSAEELYNKVTHEPVAANASAALTAAVEDAQRELAALGPRLPGVIINVSGTDTARVTLDGAEVPSAAFGVRRPADPGQHVVRAGANGFSPAEVTVTLVEGKVETVTLVLKPGVGGPPPVTAGPGAGQPGAGEGADGGGGLRRTLGFVGIGLGAAALVGGGVAGGFALKDHNDLLNNCPGGHCPNTQASRTTNQPSIDSYTAAGNAATGLFVVGGALAVTGIILVATAPKAAQTGSITPLIGPGWLGAQGKF
jgi:hypothetical protein